MSPAPPRWCTAGPAARRGRPPCDAAGLPEGPSVEGDFSAEAGAAATRELLDLADPPTAIVYANDLMAIAGLAVAVNRGIDVPGQLSITGYEDTELAAHVQPPLTTVRSDVIGWGRAAAGRLLELIEQRARHRGARCPHRSSSSAVRPAPPPALDTPRTDRPTPAVSEWRCT